MSLIKNPEELLPDWEDLDNLAKLAAQSRYKANEAKSKLETYLAECVKSVFTNQYLWINGKPPTQEYIKNVILIVGNTSEDAEVIKNLTEEQREYFRQYEETKSLLDNLKDRIEVYRTASSNARAGM